MGHVIGIDLGTVNSCVATIVDGVPLVIADPEGRKLTPSVYAVSATGTPLIGHAAAAQQEQNKQNTIFAVKRLIGLKYEDHEVKLAMKKLPYKIVPAPNGDAWVEIDDVPTSPEEVSAQILIRLKQVAEHHFGERVSQAVITVPAHFNDSQRQATKDAGRIAGLNVMRVLNEPTAAALAFGLSSYKQGVYEKRQIGSRAVIAERIVAVFDLGGGTFDVSILALRDGVFEVLSTHGDTYLGGEDFDLEIVRFIIEHFRARTGHDLGQNRDTLQKLKNLAKEAKHQLSESSRAEIHIPYVTAREHLNIELDRKSFEQIVAPILDRIASPCQMAMKDAGLIQNDIDDVILVGGMSRVPAVKKLCRQIFGREPIASIDADEAVALGASIQAGILQGLLKGVSLNDVTSLSLGIETQGGLVHTLLPRNTPIPATASAVFTTSSPNQPQVSIHLVQGESSFAPDNMSLGRFELTGIRSAPRGTPRISVELNVDTDGIVHLSARDLDTGEEQKIDIVASSGLDESAIDELLRENIAVEAHNERVELRAIRIEQSETPELPEEPREDPHHDLKSLVFMTQFKLDTEGKGFRGEPRRRLEESLLQARSLIDSASTPSDRLREMISMLQTLSVELEEFIESH